MRNSRIRLLLPAFVPVWLRARTPSKKYSACARARSPSERLRRRAARKRWARRRTHGSARVVADRHQRSGPGPAMAVAETDRQPEAPAQAGCAAWDREASEGIAELVFDSSAAAVWKLDQAIVQLRRARKHCRSGSVQAALHDYASLHRNLPFLTGSLRPTGRMAAPPVSRPSLPIPDGENSQVHRAGSRLIFPTSRSSPCDVTFS